MNNLKQIGLAFLIFSGDNNDKFPYDVPNGPAYLDQSRAWMHFQAMSNELQTAKILLCTADMARTNNRAENFYLGSNGIPPMNSQSLAKIGNDAVSYFVGLQISERTPQALLAGDRNISLKEKAQAFSSVANRSAIRVPTNAVWSTHPANKIHALQGDALIVDGSVLPINAQQMSAKSLQDQLSLSAATNGTNANLLLFPQ
ncbi:MAG: hypothetical protein HY300_00495 [Verrucomicrobia bacterium]|nr:hypothetical protein [Verrucomicrobiota bacterium]